MSAGLLLDGARVANNENPGPRFEHPIGFAVIVREYANAEIQ